MEDWRAIGLKWVKGEDDGRRRRRWIEKERGMKGVYGEEIRWLSGSRVERMGGEEREMDRKSCQKDGRVGTREGRDRILKGTKN